MMPNLIGSSNTLAMSSREIAELLDARHDSVKRTIERLAGKGVIELPPMVEIRTATNTGTEYRVGKRDSYVIVAQLSPEFTAALVDRWQELEASKAVALPSYAEALRLYADQIEATQRIAAERDQAIATKAQIGSKREASAMAKASSAVREVNRLKAELGRNQQHATVIAVERATGQKLPKNAYVLLRRWCKDNGTLPVEVVDARYGTVKAWPAAAWLAAHAIELGELFATNQEAA
jgi:phage regulator Rha-like protein